MDDMSKNAPMRELFADDVRYLRGVLSERRAAILAEENRSRSLCTHHFRDGSSAFEYAYDDDTDNTVRECAGCGKRAPLRESD